jgi:hypothetical protein
MRQEKAHGCIATQRKNWRKRKSSSKEIPATSAKSALFCNFSAPRERPIHSTTMYRCFAGGSGAVAQLVGLCGEREEATDGRATSRFHTPSSGATDGYALPGFCHIHRAGRLVAEDRIRKLDDVRLRLDEHLIEMFQKLPVGRIVRPQRKYPVGMKLGGEPFDQPLGVPD